MNRITWAVVLTIGVIGWVGQTQGAIERYKNETDYLNRLAELGYGTIHEGFESGAWDAVRSPSILDINALPSITSQTITFESAGRDIWPYSFSTRVYGVTTNYNWANSGTWGLYEDHQGDPIPTTIRIIAPEPIYGIGCYVDTNPDLQDVGFLFEGATTAEAPGYVLPGYGAMYPGDNSGAGHQFIGLIVPDGFTEVIVTGVLQVNEENVLEGGAIYGADDFTFAVTSGIPEPGAAMMLGIALATVSRRRK
ncbi:PEP-CTERM sorting domain-containing protein [Planctomycetales bacterium ZRK34]|nr:PEP-CTERM sorting domain-containing protein [Planctomycetales bacterium ZRK34]